MVWFNNQAFHTPAVSLNALTNAMLRSYTKGTVYKISASNHPLPTTTQQSITDLSS